jgi:hypothetical protein
VTAKGIGAIDWNTRSYCRSKNPTERLDYFGGTSELEEGVLKLAFLKNDEQRYSPYFFDAGPEIGGGIPGFERQTRMRTRGEFNPGTLEPHPKRSGDSDYPSKVATDPTITWP